MTARWDRLAALFLGLAASGCGSAHRGDVPDKTATASEPDTLADAEGYVKVPGARVHSSCLHTVPNGARVDKDGNVTLKGAFVTHFDRCGYPNKLDPALTSWIEYSRAFTVNNPNGDGQYFSGMTDSFTVPNLPPAGCNTQTLYFFPAFTHSTQAIIQPVLQCGRAPNGNTTGWALSSWYIGSPGTTNTPPVPVSPGDTINTGIECYNCFSDGSNCEECLTEAIDQNSGNGSLIDPYTVESWGEVDEGVLEVNNVVNCNQFPGGMSGAIAFTNTNVYEGYSHTAVSPSWQACPNGTCNTISGNNPQCNFNVSNFNGGTTLAF
jgi:hypothetical protein